MDFDIPIHDKDSSRWQASYSNDLEYNKRTTRDFANMPSQLYDLYRELTSDETILEWKTRTGISHLENDYTLHGGGFHVTYPQGHLCTHLDYAKHPLNTTKERRLNIIVFLNEWKKEWGGALQLCLPSGRVVKEIYPERGKLVAFETSDESYHGVSPVTGPIARASFAIYYLSNIRQGVTRERALFIPNRGM